MKTIKQSEVIGIQKDSITVLLSTGLRKQVSKKLFSFNVLLGDKLKIYLDCKGSVKAIEQKGCYKTHIYTDKATGAKLQIYLSPSRVCF